MAAILTSIDSDSKNFLDKWQVQPPASDRLEEQILPNGDCIIYLDVIKSDRWRL